MDCPSALPHPPPAKLIFKLPAAAAAVVTASTAFPGNGNLGLHSLCAMRGINMQLNDIHAPKFSNFRTLYDEVEDFLLRQISRPSKLS